MLHPGRPLLYADWLPSEPSEPIDEDAPSGAPSGAPPAAHRPPSPPPPSDSDAVSVSSFGASSLGGSRDASPGGLKRRNSLKTGGQLIKVGHFRGYDRKRRGSVKAGARAGGGGGAHAYVEATDHAALKAAAEAHQAALNAALLDAQPAGQLADPAMLSRLVLFPTAIEHLCRIARILGRPRGSALLVGVGGSGRRSLCKLACHVEGVELHMPTAGSAKEYGHVEWREDLRRAATRAGVDGAPVALMLSDAHIKDEALLEDVQRLLDGCEVPALLTDEETEAACSRLRAEAAREGRDPEGSMRAWLLERTHHHLHLVFAFSPIGASLRRWLRVCPALGGCTSIDVYDEWPRDALQAVAESELRGTPGFDAPLLESVVEACVTAHAGALALSRRYLAEQVSASDCFRLLPIASDRFRLLPVASDRF